MSWLLSLTRQPWFGALIVTLAAVMALGLGILKPVEDALADQRFALTERDPTGEIVVVEIDTASLRAAAEWPWTRARYAQVIDNLNAAGARQVGFDVDFTAKSDPASDAAFARAIDEARAVILPTFIQRESRYDPSSPWVENTPMARLSDQALLASVNVPMDDDGRVWRYLRGFQNGDAYRPSMAHLMAEGEYGRTEPFLIDYAIRPKNIPRLSFQDVHDGRFDPATIDGRTVLIGATALELGDTFATPHHGILSGVLVHALAFESLRQGRALHPLPIVVTLGLMFSLALWLRPSAMRRRCSLIACHAVALALIVGLPVVLQKALPVVPTVAPLLLTQLLCVVWAAQFELRRRAEAEQAAREAGLLHLAMHETETELPNRRALLAEIEKLRRAPEGLTAVVAIGFDRYPELRAAIGYGLANEVVREVAARLLRTCHGSRLGYLSTGVLGLVVHRGDRAAIEHELAALAQLPPAYEVGGNLVDVFLRLGVVYDTGLERDETLLEQATAALDEARRGDLRLLNHEAHVFPDPTLNLALMSEMQRGLEQGDISLAYQPKACARTGLITGVEALMRWRHPVRGQIRPDFFILAAEETGNIRPLTEWTVRQALADSAALRAAGHRLMVSINVSGRLLGDEGFREQALSLVSGREDELCFEITETAVIDSPTAAMDSVRAFRQAGLKVSIDDYGVGLSSLSYLKMLEADELKLDRSIAAEVADARDRMILKSTIDLAHGLGMTVVAEGVEDDAVRQVLATLGCDLIQGYLIARPLPLEDLKLRLQLSSAA